MGVTCGEVLFVWYVEVEVFQARLREILTHKGIANSFFDYRRNTVPLDVAWVVLVPHVYVGYLC